MEALDEQLLNNEMPEQMSERQIFKEIWTQPRKVFTSVHAHKQNRAVIPLIVTATTIGAIENLNQVFESQGSIGTTQIITFAVTVALSYLGYYILAALLRWTGAWMGGKAETKDILRVTAYSTIPGLPRAIFAIPLVLLYSFGNFSLNTFQTESGINIVQITLLMLGAVLGIWQFVLNVIGLSIAQEYRIGTAVLNLLLATAIIVVPFVIIVFIFSASYF